MQTRLVGDFRVSAIGLGGMPMSIEGRPERERSIATVQAALDAGVTLFDTAEAYSRDPGELGHNETLIAEAIAGYGGDTSDILISTKGGIQRPGDGSWVINGAPEQLKQSCEGSLKRLGVDSIGLYYFHRPDPTVPYAESIGALGDLLDAGKIRSAGVSNANPEQIRLARDILGDRLVSVQNQFSPAFRSSDPELELCTELGISFLPWSPFGGIKKAGELGSRFAPFAEIAAERGVSSQQVCLAWMLAKSPVLVAIPGASRPESIRDSVKAVDLELSPEEFDRLDTPSSDVPA
jgi:aryl-alcohol dehydrogenase-like predicted oxidoreductase